MTNFKQFLAEMDNEFVALMIAREAAKTPRLKIDLTYGDYDAYGFVQDAHLRSSGDLEIDFKAWSEGDHSFVPGTLEIDRDDVMNLVIEKDVEGKKVLLYKR